MRTLLHPARQYPVLRDVALLVARVAIGVVLVAHGWQKYNEYTIDGTTASFADMGVPAAGAAALLVIFAEIVGGIAVILGVLTPVFAALNSLTLLGAFVIVHVENGVFVDNGGYELVLALIAGLLLLLALGAGRFSVDGLLDRRQTAIA